MGPGCKDFGGWRVSFQYRGLLSLTPVYGFGASWFRVYVVGIDFDLLVFGLSYVYVRVSVCRY